MKKIMLVLVAILLTACGSTDSDPDNKEVSNASTPAVTETADNQEGKGNENINEESEENDEPEEVIDIPTERTAEMSNDDPPWYYFSYKGIEDEWDEGNIVFIYDDAEPLEDHIIYIMERDYSEVGEKYKDENAESMAKFIEMFMEEVSQYVTDKDDYFAKMDEVREALQDKEYEEVLHLIDEAKELRNQESQ